MQPWHRIFGVLMVDHCSDTCVEVRLEEDYSKVEQLLDCALLLRREEKPLPVLPDGIEPLADHTLVSFKSYRESFDRFALEELLGHSVAYRKFTGDGRGGPLSAEHLKLVAISGRRPAWLGEARLRFTNPQPGVYNGEYGLTPLTVVVPRELEATEKNASLLLLSGDEICIGRSSNLLRLKNKTLGTEIIDSAYRHYGEEGFRMAFTVEQFRREVRQEFLAECTVEERLMGLAPEDRLRGLAPEDLAQRLPVEVRLRGLAAEDLAQRLPVEVRLRGLAAEDRLRGLSLAEIHQLAAQLQTLLQAADPQNSAS